MGGGGQKPDPCIKGVIDDTDDASRAVSKRHQRNIGCRVQLECGAGGFCSQVEQLHGRVEAAAKASLRQLEY